MTSFNRNVFRSFTGNCSQPFMFSLAIQVRRSDTLAVPVSTIEIIDSVFEHGASEQEMCSLYNIQPADSIIIRGYSFIHAFCTFHFGAQNVSQVAHFGAVKISNSSFAEYGSSLTLAAYDLDADAPRDLPARNTMRAANTSFSSSDGPSMVVRLALAAKNAQACQRNRFRENAVEHVISLSAATSSFAYQYAPNVNQARNQLDDNACASLICVSAAPTQSSYSEAHIPFVLARRNAFDDSAEPYLVSLRTQSARLNASIADNTFANGSIVLADPDGSYIELASPLHAMMTQQSVDCDSRFVLAVDVAQSVTLQYHTFAFADNVGTILATATAPVLDVLQLHRLQFARNTIISAASSAARLLDLQYLRLSIVALDLHDNYCRDAGATLTLSKSGQNDDVMAGDFGDGCIAMTDCSLSVALASFSGDNGTFIWQLRRYRDAHAVSAAPVCMEALRVDANFAHAFLYILNCTESDALSFAHSNMSYAWLNYAFFVDGQNTADANRSQGSQLTMSHMLFERIGSAADGNYYLALIVSASTFRDNAATAAHIWKSERSHASLAAISSTQFCIESATVRRDSAADAFLSVADYVAVEVSDSRFSTMALSLQLNADATANRSSTLALQRNEFANYIDDSAELYLGSLRTQGARLDASIADHTFANGSVALADPDGCYIELAGPLHATMTQQSVDRDVAQMTLQHHTFGANIGARAVFVERSHVSLTPAVTLDIAHSLFENAHVDRAMLPFTNIQPGDAIVLEHAHFVHAYLHIVNGAATPSMAGVASDAESLVVRHSSFAQHAEHPTLAISDDGAAAPADANVTRRVSHFENNTFSHSAAPDCSIWMEWVRDNDNEAQPRRVVLAGNGFDAISLLRCACDAASYSALSHAASPSRPLSPFVRATANTFDANLTLDGVLFATECALRVADAHLSAHSFLIPAAVAVVDVFAESTDADNQLLFLADAANCNLAAEGASVRISNAPFSDSELLMQLYVAPQDEIVIRDSHFEQALMRADSGSYADFSNYDKRAALFVSASDADWAPNVSLSSCSVHDNADAALFALLSLNSNKQRPAFWRVEHTRFANNDGAGGIFEIVEPVLPGELTVAPSEGLTSQPTALPTRSPLTNPTSVPSAQPSGAPTYGPSTDPSASPRWTPSTQPTRWPTSYPTAQPSASTPAPTLQPTLDPTQQPSADPTAGPTAPGRRRLASAVPTSEPTTAAPAPAPAATPDIISSNASNVAADWLAVEDCASEDAYAAQLAAHLLITAYHAVVSPSESRIVDNAELVILSSTQSVLSLANATLRGNSAATAASAFTANEGTLLASNRSSLSVSATTFESHLGSLALLRVDLEQRATFAECDVAEQKLFVMTGSIEELRSSRTKFQDVAFADNVGTILATATAPVLDADTGVVADLCSTPTPVLWLTSREDKDCETVETEDDSDCEVTKTEDAGLLHGRQPAGQR